MQLKSLTRMGLALAFCLAALPLAAQQPQVGDQPGESPSSVAPSDAQGQPGTPAQQQTDVQPPQAQPDQQAEGQPDTQAQGQPGQQQALPQQPQNQAVPPQTLTLPAGTVIRVRTDDWLSSDHNAIGDSFSASLDQPIVANGWVVARRGQSETGRVSVVKPGGHGNSASQLGVELPELTLVDGQQVPLQTQLFQASGGSPTGRNVAAVGSTTGLGAVIGAIAGGGTGAAIGAGLGATAGIIGVMSTPDRPTVIPAETVLSFRLQAPVTISTQNSQFAFQPVQQSDYDSRSSQGRPPMARPGPPPPPAYPYGPYPYAYPYAYAYPPYAYPWYPAPFVGFGYYGRFGRWR